MSVMLDAQHEPVSKFAASELDGVLELNPGYAAFSLSELEALVQSAGETLRDTLFTIGDAALSYISRAGSRPSDRAQALQALSAASGVTPAELRHAVRVSRAFPPSERMQYAGQPKSWFEVLTERTGLPGDTPEERAERRRALAEECADLSARQTRQVIDERLRPKERGDFLELEDEPAPHPAHTALPPLETPEAAPVPEVVRRATDGLERRLKDEAPGLWSDVALIVQQHLAERLAAGWKLEAPYV